MMPKRTCRENDADELLARPCVEGREGNSL